MPPDFYATTLEYAEDMLARGEQDEIMPRSLIPPIFMSPVSAYRWHSLIAKGGDDDYFSSDLGDEELKRTFGRLDKETLILVAGEDEMVPRGVDKEGLLERWVRASGGNVVSALSEVVEGADHALSGEGMRTVFAERVMRFLGGLEGRGV